MEPRTKRIHATVSGRVQGVSFRASTADQAVALRLTGWVRNLPNGDVELEAQGSENNISELLSWLHQGPAAARVSNVVSNECPLSTHENDFRITY